MVDIIIPAYNAFSTIGLTLGSIAKQINRENIMVYIVNDGSTSSYKDIIDNYKNLLSIKEIVIKNSGPGVARQVGIDSSSNEFIVFMDADDILYNEYSIINLLNIINDADLAQGNFIEKKEYEDITRNPQYCYLHGKMYRRSIIKKYKLKFDPKRRYDGDVYEDSTFNQLYSLCCQKINNTEELIYVYQYNVDSITRKNTNTSQHLRNFVDAMTWLVKEINKRKIDNPHYIAWNMCIICMHAYFNYLF